MVCDTPSPAIAEDWTRVHPKPGTHQLRAARSPYQATAGCRQTSQRAGPAGCDQDGADSWFRPFSSVLQLLTAIHPGIAVSRLALRQCVVEAQFVGVLHLFAVEANRLTQHRGS